MVMCLFFVSERNYATFISAKLKMPDFTRDSAAPSDNQSPVHLL